MAPIWGARSRCASDHFLRLSSSASQQSFSARPQPTDRDTRRTINFTNVLRLGRRRPWASQPAGRPLSPNRTKTNKLPEIGCANVARPGHLIGAHARSISCNAMRRRRRRHAAWPTGAGEQVAAGPISDCVSALSASAYCARRGPSKMKERTRLECEYRVFTFGPRADVTQAGRPVGRPVSCCPPASGVNFVVNRVAPATQAPAS